MKIRDRIYLKLADVLGEWQVRLVLRATHEQKETEPPWDPEPEKAPIPVRPRHWNPAEDPWFSEGPIVPLTPTEQLGIETLKAAREKLK